MPWQESDIMSERTKFVGRLLDGEKMANLCQEFGISRKTGYKILNRYKDKGPLGLLNESRRPFSSPRQTPEFLIGHILEIKKSFPSWGAPKIRERLIRKKISPPAPSISTIHSILVKNNLVKRQARQRSFKAQGTGLGPAERPNELWCTDFKGQFRLKNQKYCYPLTVSDRYSRFLVGCESLEGTEELPAIESFEIIFKEYGLPDRMRSDNGVPFSSRSLFGLSLLSVWWLRLGIRLERIDPGHPEQNGQHERMHRELKFECAKNPAKNHLEQQEILDNFVQIYNHERPHQGIGMKCPTDLYRPSKKLYKCRLEDYPYPNTIEQLVRVSNCGGFNFKFKRYFIGTPLAHQVLGLKEIEEGLWAVYFMEYEFGYIDTLQNKFARGVNPFLIGMNKNVNPLLPMSPE